MCVCSVCRAGGIEGGYGRTLVGASVGSAVGALVGIALGLAVGLGGAGAGRLS